MDTLIKIFQKSLTFYFPVLFVCFQLIACGGGDGGGGGSASLEYTGLKTQATIDASNAVDIFITAYKGGSPGNILGGALNKGDATSVPDGSKSQILFLSRVFEKAARKVHFTSSKNKSGIQYKTESDTFSGSCGGEFSITINVNEETGDFDGGFTLTNFCEDDTTISGSGDISGQVVSASNATFKFSFGPMNITSGSGSFTFSGDISVNLDGSTTKVTMDMFLKNNDTQKVFWVNNLSVTANKGSSSINLSISGQFYHPDHGFVDIRTETVLRIDGSDDFPSSGAVVAEGSNGTQAQLVAISSTKFRVTTGDSDGDGIIDFDSGELNWVDF